MVYDPAFAAPAWAKNAVIYQIFPDRFRNGRSNNNPKTGDIRYDDPVLKLPWGTLPEGYCRNYADGAHQLPVALRHHAARRIARPRNSPRGRDYMGGDLKGVDQNLDYLQVAGRQHASTSTRSSTRAPTTATTPRITTRSTPTSARRRTGRTWSSMRTSSACGSSWTACSTTCRPTARSLTAITTTPTVGACEMPHLALPRLVHLP